MTKNMTAGDPARLIFFFALPLIAGNMMQQLYSFVDTIIVGRFLGVILRDDQVDRLEVEVW